MPGNSHERKPIITNAAHCARALSLLEQGGIYFGLGRTSPWTGENVEGFIPPAPDVNATTLDELIGMKKVDRMTMVIPDPEGEIEYASIRFRTLSPEQAFELKSRWVLAEVLIFYDELPPVAYRQVGLFSRVVPRPGMQTKAVLLPGEIEDVGILEVLNNRKVVTRQSDTRDRYFMIIEC